MKVVKFCSASANEFYSLKYTPSCFKVLKKLSAFALSDGFPTADLLICAPIA
jgi:hypothetical protein